MRSGAKRWSQVRTSRTVSASVGLLKQLPDTFDDHHRAVIGVRLPTGLQQPFVPAPEAEAVADAGAPPVVEADQTVAGRRAHVFLRLRIQLAHQPRRRLLYRLRPEGIGRLRRREGLRFFARAARAQRTRRIRFPPKSSSKAISTSSLERAARAMLP